MSGLLDDMVERYVEWREDADAVAEAYTQWSGARAREEEWRFSVYLASLELEESSAKSYAAVVTELDSRLRHAERRARLRRQSS
jgi:hypothetical protein